MEKTITGITAFTSATIASLFGVIDMPIQGLLWFMLFDMVSGLLTAGYHKKLSSEVMYKGIFKKAGMLLVIMVSHRLDIVLDMDNMMIRNTACMFYLAMEGLSIVENVGQVVALPAFLVDIITKLHSDNDKVKEMK